MTSEDETQGDGAEDTAPAPTPVAKAKTSIAAVAAHWNDDARHPIASFHSQSDADAFADAYGGSVERSGVAFTVADGADHERAQKDADALTRG